MMEGMQSANNKINKLLTAEIIGNFIQNRQLSLREITKKSGITAANFSKCFNGKTMLTLPYFVRIAAASGSDELYDWAFDIPVKKYLAQKVKSPDILSDADYIFLLILLKDYWMFRNEHCAEGILNAVFNMLSRELFLDHTDNTCSSDSIKVTADYSNCFYNMFYDDKNLIGYSYRDISVDDHHMGMLMHSGGTVIWQDVRNLITWYLTDNSLKRNSIKSRSILSRIRSTSEQAYKVDDLLDVDEELQMNGVFFSACCLAAKNNIMMNKIFTDDSNVDSDLLAKVQYGIASFFSCLRILEQDPGKRQVLENFLSFFRQTAAASQYHMAELRGLSETFHDFLPINSFRFYL